MYVCENTSAMSDLHPQYSIAPSAAHACNCSSAIEFGFCGSGEPTNAKRALIPVLPSPEDFAYSIRVVSEITESNDNDTAADTGPVNVEIGGKPLLFGKDVTVGGIVSSFQIRTTKTGNPFCIFKLEDYAGSMEMALFGEDFVKFSAYIQTGHFLFVKGKIQTRWKSDDQYEFKITSMQLLSEVREKLTKEIRLQLDLELLDGDLVSKLNQAVQDYPGSCALTVSVFDHLSRTEVKLQSRTHRVAPSNEFFKLIESMGGVKFSVN